MSGEGLAFSAASDEGRDDERSVTTCPRRYAFQMFVFFFSPHVLELACPDFATVIIEL